MKKGLIYGAATIIVLALIFWKLNSNKKNNETRTAVVKESSSGSVPVFTELVTRTAFAQAFSANGNFKAVKQIDFSAEAPGRIVALMVKEGSAVRAGQVLARIDNQVASADIQNAQANVDQAKRDLERYQTAFASGGVTQKQVDDARLQVRNMQTRYAQASKNIQNTLLRSPIDGVINAKYVEVGAYLAAGTKLFEIVDISRLKLVVNVPETQVVQLRLGQAVPVTTNVYPEATYQGKVTFIAAKGDATLNYPIEVEVTNISGKELKAGMYGTASFDLPHQEPALFIPRAAFYAGISNKAVFVLDSGKAKARIVTAGRVTGDQVEVREGLKEGETVIVSGQVNLVDGTPVTAQKK
jgi:RND family efflux transporter MFP subunit